MRHIFLAVLFGISCGIVSIVGIDIYMKTGELWGLIVLILSFLAAFNFTIAATIPLGIILTRNSPFVKNAHVLLGWTVALCIGIYLVVLPALSGD